MNDRKAVPFIKHILSTKSYNTLVSEDLPALEDLEKILGIPREGKETSSELDELSILTYTKLKARLRKENLIEVVYRQLVRSYLGKYELDKTKAADKEYIKALAVVGAEEGSDALNARLFDKYGFQLFQNTWDGIEKQNQYGLNISTLSEDIFCYYEDVVGVSDLDIIKAIIEHGLLVGICVFDEEVKEFYGISLTEYNLRMGKQVHINGSFKPKPIDLVKLRRDLNLYVQATGHFFSKQQKRALIRLAHTKGVSALNEYLRENYGVSLDELNIMMGRDFHG